MPHTSDGFEWEFPARVLAVLDGESFVADIDLGFGIHLHRTVLAEGITAEPITTPRGLRARKEAQRLLLHADLMLRTRRIVDDLVVADVAYAPWFTPRSEQGSFMAAMLASGLVDREEES